MLIYLPKVIDLVSSTARTLNPRLSFTAGVTALHMQGLPQLAERDVVTLWILSPPVCVKDVSLTERACPHPQTAISGSGAGTQAFCATPSLPQHADLLNILP